MIKLDIERRAKTSTHKVHAEERRDKTSAHETVVQDKSKIEDGHEIKDRPEIEDRPSTDDRPEIEASPESDDRPNIGNRGGIGEPRPKADAEAEHRGILDVDDKSSSDGEIWIDNDGCPHIVAAIIGLVDKLLSNNSVLAGYAYPEYNPCSLVTVLHNGVWPMIADYRTYRDLTIEGDMPFGVSGGVLGNESQVVAIPHFGRTQVLDIVGTVRGTAPETLAPLMPNLHTIRTYTTLLGDFTERNSDSRATVLWHHRGGNAGHLAWTSYIDDTPEAPRMPPIQRVVNFTTMTSSESVPARLSPANLDTVNELVTTVMYNLADEKGCQFYEIAQTPQSLRHATILFLPSNSSLHRDGDHSGNPERLHFSFTHSLRQLRVPTIIVGLDGVPCARAWMDPSRMVALRRAVPQPLTFVSLAEFRKSVSDVTWDIYTRPADIAVMKAVSRMRGYPGTAIVGRIGEDLSPRHPRVQIARRKDSDTREQVPGEVSPTHQWQERREEVPPNDRSLDGPEEFPPDGSWEEGSEDFR